jgi:hypothetical protein
MRDNEKERRNDDMNVVLFSPFPYDLEFMTSQNCFLSLDLGKKVKIMKTYGRVEVKLHYS